MSIKLPKIKNNFLFAPSLLILSFIASLFLANLDLREKSYQYSYLLIVTCFLFGLKNYVLGFGLTEEMLHKKKWLVLGPTLTITCLQFVLVFLAAKELTQSTYPNYTIGWLLIGQVVFSLVSFLVNSKVSILLNILVAIFYAIFYIALYFNLFQVPIEFYILILHAIAYLSFLFEALLLFLTFRYYTKVHAK